MQALADTLYRQPAQSKAARPAAAEPARDVADYARIGGGQSLAARVRAYFAQGWSLYVANAREAAPIRWL
ncbi:hypothetical protein VSR17_07030 [Cupriavidus taiwanensis]|uniref:Uncharacterized protein n=1 Tax=Cupriavidus taiwanensis TaxID=164546 RepID=A0A375HN46_9BURK|nr:hypothetical protein [Cupriavidus taiwanensis]SOY68564.1 hypothetical protein CBM2592_B180111 [Cupriavidus taiwanensis]SOY69964.1 hypothetical protein CBM2588_B200112 [Cupriavidus taiwanensis]SOY95353.1 hypothetical protein CBM2591_B170109 [Cupriavidus taiwanensis]SOZ28425.1 hypothetical protein CBM2608_B140325 [Cupriavidus taiwanensis]SOZ71984.1 hypothetical protein CBM2617_B180321 [Cupriavidus taiwanensis]